MFVVTLNLVLKHLDSGLGLLCFHLLLFNIKIKLLLGLELAFDLRHQLLLLLHQGVELKLQLLVLPLQFILSLVDVLHLLVFLNHRQVQTLKFLLQCLVFLVYLRSFSLKFRYSIGQLLSLAGFLEQLLLSIVQLVDLRSYVLDYALIPVYERPC